MILLGIILIIIGIILGELLRYVGGFPSFLARTRGPWIGFDLDGTLAISSHDKFHPKAIGEPIPAVVKLAKKYIAEGMEVKILTARVGSGLSIVRVWEAVSSRRHIQKWCLKHIGRKLDVTCAKDFRMVVLYDDRSRRVESNTGKLL